MSLCPSWMTLRTALPRMPGSSRKTRMRPPVISGVKIDVTVRSKASDENSGQVIGRPPVYTSRAHQM